MAANSSYRTENDSQNASVGRTVREILNESRNRRFVIRNRSEKKIIDLSLLLVVILSIGAPVLPVVVIMGVLVDVINVSIE